ncbi:hypothetical protein [Actinoplanes sp. NPDC049802]|uniref:hypothetical protein n=1 Tax=Actinoplanes sp. NPDC049802 TaxID=3154742 RepID=UPI0033CEBEE5
MMRRVWASALGVLLCMMMSATSCVASAAVLGVALNGLAGRLADTVHHAGVDVNVAVVRSGAELERAIENARAAWGSELDKTLDSVDDSVQRAYNDLDQLLKDIQSGVDATVRDAGDRAQVLANQIPFADRSPQIRKHTGFVVVGASTFRSGPAVTVRSTSPRGASRTITTTDPPAGWHVDRASVRAVTDARSPAGVFTTTVADTATGAGVTITATPMWGTTEAAEITAHLEWTEISDARSVRLDFEGNFFWSGRTDPPTLTFENVVYPVADDTDVTRLTFLIPEAAFGTAAVVPTPRQMRLRVPYQSNYLHRRKVADYAVSVTVLPPQPGTATLSHWPTETTFLRWHRATGQASVDSNLAGEDGGYYDNVFTFGVPAEDKALGYVVDPASIRIQADSSAGKWYADSISTSDSISVHAYALNCDWYKVQCPDGKVTFHVEYDVVKPVTGNAVLPVVTRVPLQWGSHVDVPVPDDLGWELAFTDIRGVRHRISTQNYTQDPLVRIIVSRKTVGVEVADPANLR